MKLNLGCGGEHKKGYLNVDAFNKTIADREMEATNLLFDDCSLDEILMSQVIEHLGIARSIYSLSECFRILKNKGKLIIETPDLRKSFKIYLNGEREDRKYILPWIYGVDMPGMQHRFCFPDDLLEEELKKIGFNEIKKKYIQFDKYEPILKIECKKITDNPFNQFMTKFRRELISKKILDLDEQIDALEIEEIVDFLKEKIVKFYKEKNKDSLKFVLSEGIVRSPKITIVFFQQLLKEGLINKEMCEKYLKLISDLDDKNFLKHLLEHLMSKEGFIGETGKLFEETYDYGKSLIDKIVINNKIEEVNLNRLLKVKKADKIIDIDVLSEKLIMLKSNQIFQKGIKAFNQNNYKKAIAFFQEAYLLNRDQILTFWNLARLYRISKDKKRSYLYYQNAIRLFDYINFEKNDLIKKLLEEEMMNLSERTFNKPINSLRENYEK